MLHIKLKGVIKCSNMVANILPADPACPHPVSVDGVNRSKFDIFRIWSLKGIMKCSSMVANILPTGPYPAPIPLVLGSTDQNSTFSEHGHVAYQIKMESRNAATW